MSDTLQQQLQQCLITLDVGPNCSWKDIETQYRQLIHRWHPDRHADDKSKEAENKFIEINTAYKMVREHYRKTGAIPREMPEDQGALLGSRKNQPVRKPALYKRKAFMWSILGITIIVIATVVFWSLDARITANNRDRATIEKSSSNRESRSLTHWQMDSKNEDSTQSSNTIEP